MNSVYEGVQVMSNPESLYEDAIKSICLILKKRYKMSASAAEKAIRICPLKSVFDVDPVMAAHTSNEAWARDVYEYWQKHGEQ